MPSSRDRTDFHVELMNTIADHPDWMHTAMKAIADGMEIALAHANARAAKYDLAMRSALSLADPGRLSAEAKAALNSSICEAIIPGCASEVERKFLERAANAMAD